MALNKVLAPGADSAAPSASKLQNFATALGILNTVAGLGSSAYGSLSTKPGTTSQSLQKGFSLEGTPGALPAPSAENIKTYQANAFGPAQSGQVPSLGHGLSLSGAQSMQQSVDPSLLRRLQNPLFTAGTSGFTQIQQPTSPIGVPKGYHVGPDGTLIVG